MSMLLGVGIGLLIALFLRVIVHQSPAELPPDRSFWMTIIFVANGALVGLAIESIRQLQENYPDPDYRRRRRR